MSERRFNSVPYPNERNNAPENPAIQEYAQRIGRAQILVASDQGIAAAVLVGLPVRMIQEWYNSQGKQAPSAEDLIPDLEKGNMEIAWQLRHALSEHDVDAHISHCRNLYSTLFGKTVK